MTQKTQTAELISTLRARINPTYAACQGTESYERRLCVEALEGLVEENEALRAQVELMRTWSQPGS